MEGKRLTFVDASVLIHAAKRPEASTFEIRSRALLILGDPNREFVASEFLKMEVLPLALFHKKKRESEFYETFFNRVLKWADCEKLLKPAYEIEVEHCVGVLDALHIAAAMQFEAEFISSERPTKPLYRAYVNTFCIY